jgi:hypothetical protein
MAAKVNVERFDCQSAFADRQGGLRRSSWSRVVAS